MQLDFILALGFLPSLLAAKEVLHRRTVDCDYDTSPSTGDTCESFAQTWGLTISEFKNLNPGARCPNLDTSKDYCVIGTATDSGPYTTTTMMTSTTTKSSPEHSPTMPGVVGNCDGFHKIVSGDQCDALVKKYGISSAQFHKWNTGVNEKCTNLYLDYYVCVHVPGAVTTAPGQPTPTPTGPQPQMPGITDDCKKYYKVVSGDSCYAIEQKYNVSLNQLRQWNNQINPGCTNILSGFYICVGV